MIQRREVKSPFTKEERQGVFVTREESRERRNRLTRRNPYHDTEDGIEITEQELHKELRERNFQYPVSWSTECFENDSLYILNKLLDNCEFQEVDLHSKY